MSRRGEFPDWMVVLRTWAAVVALVGVSRAQYSSPPSSILPSPAAATWTGDLLQKLSPSQLDQLYRSAGPGILPAGKVRGVPIVLPGKPLGPSLSRATRVVWQGKVIRDDGLTAVNRFFGVRVIEGNLCLGSSWVDGRPSLILDYQETSLVYRRYRDEIRQISPGLYLGVMHARTSNGPAFTRYFALETRL
ncbi:MAG: hypothetical protein NVSMB9_09780 [Isosphaeraceae bacterium]